MRRQPHAAPDPPTPDAASAASDAASDPAASDPVASDPVASDPVVRDRVWHARVARLATIRPDGTPRLVPVTFALVDSLICSAVDEVKPKRHIRLARIADISRDPRVGLLIDHYAEDWSGLWWVRIDGTAALHTADGPDRALWQHAMAALATKYPPYRAAPPPPAMLVITPHHWTTWSAT